MLELIEGKAKKGFERMFSSFQTSEYDEQNMKVGMVDGWKGRREL